MENNIEYSKPHLKPWNPPSSIYRELRQLTRLEVHFKDIRTMLTNHREGLSHQYECSKEALKQLDALIRSIDIRIDSNQAAIEALMASDADLTEKLEYIQSIKGIGMLSAVTLLAETDGFDNITSRKQLASFAGLDVVARDSGSAAPARHISKKGNSYIRRSLYLCSISAAIYNPQMKALYCRLSQRKPAMVARAAVMRKLLLLAYTLCKAKTTYNSGITD